MNLSDVRVLLVDDEAFMRSTVRRMLRLLGCTQVEEAESGDAALQRLENFKADVLICDIGMMPMDGLVFTRTLREHESERLRRLPVIMLTGHSDHEIVRDALKLGISGYLLKPVSTNDLRSRLQAAVCKP